MAYRDGRGKVTRGCASHAVSDDEHPRGDVSRVLIIASDQTDFGVASNIEGKGHCSSPTGDGHGGPANSHLVPHRQARRILDALTVDMGAVGRGQILNEPCAVDPWAELGMVGGGVVVVDR